MWFLRQIQNKLLKGLGREKRPPILPPWPGLSSAKRRIRPQRLNFLASRVGGKVRYLEIGISSGATLGAVRATRKTGVDPFPRMDVRHLPRGVEVIAKESDVFFRSCSDRYDLIFVDGLHTGVQTYRDIVAAFNVLEPSGFLLVDDVLPTDEASALPSMADSDEKKLELGIAHRRWYGDTWKAVATVLRFHPEIEVRVVGNEDNVHGQAVMWRDPGSRESLKLASDAVNFMNELNFDDFLSRKTRLGWPQEVDTISSVVASGR